MYGLLIEGLHNFVVSSYSEELWGQILSQANVGIKEFEIRKVYSETVLPMLMKTAAKVLNLDEDDVKYRTGCTFVDYLSSKGYQSLLRVLGRDLRDFLNGLDNLHQFLRSTYPKMNPPSFFCVNESRTGITLKYRSRRKGFVPFFRGWMEKLSDDIYDTQMKIEIVYQKEFDTIMRLHFKNFAFPNLNEDLPLPARIFFEAFPFNLVFDRGMKIINIGKSMANAMPDILGKFITDEFTLTRPQIEFSWDIVMLHTNNLFELCSSSASSARAASKKSEESEDSETGFHLRGQMKYMIEWDAITFLGTPIMKDVNAMWEVGLYLNDLSMHDSSRDMVLAGEQQSAELKLALEQESEKRRRLEESLRRLDEEMKRTDELLYQMIPRAVAERLRSGEAAMDTCENFEDVTILLSDVVGFTTICSGLSPLGVVELLNKLYSCFDSLTEKHKVYKVETIGDAYLIASGCPVRTKFHASLIAEMALDMVKYVQTVRDESKDPPESLRIRVGLNTGLVVAGVVGVKMPRYCLFGSTVTTAEMMEQTSSPQRIQISESTNAKLIEYEVYDISPKGTVELKNGSKITTYWLDGRADETKNKKAAKLCEQLSVERAKFADANMSSDQTKSGEGWESVTASHCDSASALASKAGSVAASQRPSMADRKLFTQRKSIADKINTGAPRR
ncbi:unnamed protein product [Calicophoron daubneyi]|uniref:guanylate cyclase n=1 Tax=Calicophoron daubneyi TaxID=300641 RepID=A0AAV2TQA2_CALDB